MKRSSARPSTLFLMELIIGILFFSVTAAVCVQFLAKSHSLSQQSALLRNAEQRCASIAEIVSAADSRDDIPELISGFFESDIDFSNESFSIYFDAQWNSCTREDAAQAINVLLEPYDDMLKANITAVSLKADNEFTEIYSLGISHHLQKEVALP